MLPGRSSDMALARLILRMMNWVFMALAGESLFRPTSQPQSTNGIH